MKFKLIVVVVNAELTDTLVKVAKDAGSTGATIIPARGTGIHEALTFFGLTLESHRSVILMVVADYCAAAILHSIRENGHFRKPGTGIAFTVDLDKVIGLESQLSQFDCDRMPDENLL
ncbi:MAG: P-II family nitrogen regulator [Magnetococcales bacterium]|nr:P-II family nitrogen regulator [Magnetococcales bacterium]NGZ26422.1 P-II family nitrogen regulator [Magnetococcales bacterium]